MINTFYSIFWVCSLIYSLTQQISRDFLLLVRLCAKHWGYSYGEGRYHSLLPTAFPLKKDTFIVQSTHSTLKGLVQYLRGKSLTYNCSNGMPGFLHPIAVHGQIFFVLPIAVGSEFRTLSFLSWNTVGAHVNKGKIWEENKMSWGSTVLTILDIISTYTEPQSIFRSLLLFYNWVTRGGDVREPRSKPCNWPGAKPDFKRGLTCPTWHMTSLHQASCESFTCFPIILWFFYFGQFTKDS